MRRFLYYWQPHTADELVGEDLDHSASDQFGKLQEGDHVWHVTVRNGKLYVVGRIIVGRIHNQDDAIRATGTTDLWPRRFHILPAGGTTEPVCPVCNVPLSRLARSLRFNSDRERLSSNGGTVDPKQLRTMRELTPESADDLEDAFKNAAPRRRRPRLNRRPGQHGGGK